MYESEIVKVKVWMSENESSGFFSVLDANLLQGQLGPQCPDWEREQERRQPGRQQAGMNTLRWLGMVFEDGESGEDDEYGEDDEDYGE